MFASISIDLDGLDCYHSIHGLPAPRAGDPVYGIALQRYLRLLDDLDIRSTLFVITRYLDEDPGAIERLSAAAERGHELGSHTHTHPYNLRRLDIDGVIREIDDAGDRLEACAGRRPVGFRAPGYNAGERVLDCLEERGYRYDSSVFPCPPYYLAKAAVMGALWLVGRRSGSSLTDPRGLLAPLQPYQPVRGRFYRPGGATRRELWEIPMSVVPGLRLPVIGTTLALFGSRSFRRVYPWLRARQPFLNIEFHGVDFLGPDDDGLSPALLERQPDLRVPLPEKMRSYRDVLRLLQNDYAFGALADMVDELEAGRA